MDFFPSPNNPHGLSPEERAAVGVLRFGKGNPTALLAITRAIHNTYTARKIRPPSNLNITDVLDGALSKGIPIIPTPAGDGYYLADNGAELSMYQNRLGILRKLVNQRLHHVAYTLRSMKGMWGTNPSQMTPPAVLTTVAVRENLEQAKEILDDPAATDQRADTERRLHDRPDVEACEIPEGVDCEASTGDIAAT